MKNRNLKIGYKARTTGHKRETKYSPNLPLSGDWLTEAGFEIGQMVRVEIARSQITISIV